MVPADVTTDPPVEAESEARASEEPRSAGGRVIGGKYRVAAELGTARGLCYRAVDEQTSRAVVVQLFPPSVFDGTDIERLRHEIRALVKLQSDHAARILEVDTEPTGALYVVRPWLEGQGLVEWLAERGPVPVGEAVLLALQAAEVLAEAHALDVVLRELEPGDLFVTRRPGGDLRLVLVDFGTAKLAPDAAADLDAPTATALLGASPYASPEIVKKSRLVDARADVWSLGAVLYEVLTGRPPFSGDASELMLQILTAAPTPPSSLRADVPAELDAAVGWALAKDVDERFRDMHAFAHALTPFAPPEGKLLVERIGRITKEAKDRRRAEKKRRLEEEARERFEQVQREAHAELGPVAAPTPMLIAAEPAAPAPADPIVETETASRPLVEPPAGLGAGAQPPKTAPSIPRPTPRAAPRPDPRTVAATAVDPADDETHVLSGSAPPATDARLADPAGLADPGVIALTRASAPVFAGAASDLGSAFAPPSSQVQPRPEAASVPERSEPVPGAAAAVVTAPASVGEAGRTARRTPPPPPPPRAESPSAPPPAPERAPSTPPPALARPSTPPPALESARPASTPPPALERAPSTPPPAPPLARPGSTPPPALAPPASTPPPFASAPSAAAEPRPPLLRGGWMWAGAIGLALTPTLLALFLFTRGDRTRRASAVAASTAVVAPAESGAPAAAETGAPGLDPDPPAPTAPSASATSAAETTPPAVASPPAAQPAAPAAAEPASPSKAAPTGDGMLVAVAVGGKCTFLVNGAPRGGGTTLRIPLRAGTYVVGCKPAGSPPKTRTVTVGSGATAMATFKLP